MQGYENYDLTENDPYLIPNSECLKNLLGFTDTAALNHAEQKLTMIRLAALSRSPVTATFDLNHLCQIHRRLFASIYPFAGQIRTVEISKGGILFLPYKMIKSEAAQCFKQLKQEHFLTGLNQKEFGERAGFFLAWINRIHAFREGNGRTQRVLINQLAEKNGFKIQWSAISGEAMAMACRAARDKDSQATELSRLIRVNTISA